MLPSNVGPKPYDVLIVGGSSLYTSTVPYLPDRNGIKYPYFQVVDQGGPISFTQKLPTTPLGFPSTTTTVSVGDKVRWMFIEEGHRVIEVNSDGTPHGALAFNSGALSINSPITTYDWIPTGADLGDHWYMCNVVHAGDFHHIVHKITIIP